MTLTPPTKCTRLKQVYKRSEKTKKTLLYTCTYMFYTYQFTARCFVLLEEMGKLFFLHYFSTCGGLLVKQCWNSIHNIFTVS